MDYSSMTIGHKIGRLMDYLQTGGEVEIDGHTWVWLDDHIAQTSVDRNLETQYWGINGLAIKGIKIKDGVAEPHYIGQDTIPFQSFVELAEKLKEEDWVNISVGYALMTMNKDR
ncbi:hypothetical protein [Shouchella clausii]|uniref:Uncharacterized protein n=1 Tax=Shouchella clausii TaxID=79880 RepID=A0A268NVW9_SHOCL|nr:hypothetical protein [Shouchella clausii]PAE87677.1 hypothetical protein CHH72_17065 [Shouchella clausii]